MDAQDEQKNQSLKILRLLNAQASNDDTRSRLFELINQIKNDGVAWPVSKEDWRLLGEKTGLHFSRSQYKKILLKFPPHEQKVAENAKKRHLK